MPRRITVECPDGHREEITIGINDHIPICQMIVERVKPLPKTDYDEIYVGPCRRRREIIWLDGSAGFRIKGMTKRF